MFVEHRDDHGADRDDALAVRSRLLQRFLDENGRQPATAELRVDFGVVEDPLTATVEVAGEANGSTLDRDRVPALLGGDRGLRTGFVGGHPASFRFDACLGSSRVAGSGGAGSRASVPRIP